MYVKIEGTWHKVNDEQTETLCGLDLFIVDDRMDGGGPAPLGARCATCIVDAS